jgi:hypothetical protein
VGIHHKEETPWPKRKRQKRKPLNAKQKEKKDVKW